MQGVAPDGYGLTTPDQLRVSSYAGAQINVAFGAAAGVVPVAPSAATTDQIANTPAETDASVSSPLSDKIGLLVFAAAGIVLVVGLGITVAMRRR